MIKEHLVILAWILPVALLNGLFHTCFAVSVLSGCIAGVAAYKVAFK